MDQFRLPDLGDYSQRPLVSPLIRLASGIAVMTMMTTVCLMAPDGAKRDDSVGVVGAKMRLSRVTLPPVTVVARREQASTVQDKAMRPPMQTADLGACAFCACANQATISR